MEVYRFMSDDEYAKLMAGEVLINTTNHHKENGRSTTSLGFCFFTEEPSEAIRWLGGVCYPDCCVKLDIPEDLLTVTYALYRDPDKDDVFSNQMIRMRKKEYCLQRYSINDGVKVISMTRQYSRYSHFRRMLIEMGIIQ